MRYKAGALLATTALALLGYSGLDRAQGGGELRLAYINSNEIIAQTPGAAEAQATFEQRLNDLQQVAQRRQQELVQPIFEKITGALMEIRNEHNYSMIFDAAAGALIAADTTLDITDMVIARLKKQAEAEQGAGKQQ